MKRNQEEVKQDLEKQKNLLEKRINIAKSSIEDFGKRHLNGIKEETLIHCLRRATDIAEGGLNSANANLVETVSILNRALLEALLMSCWISKSEENAKKYSEAGFNDMKRIIKKNIEAGHAKITSKSTKEDKSQEFLASPKMSEIGTWINFKNVAEVADVMRIYTTLYGFLSMKAHGFTYGITEDQTTEENLYCALCAINSTFKCIILVASNQVERRKNTSTEELYKILFS